MKNTFLILQADDVGVTIALNKETLALSNISRLFAVRSCNSAFDGFYLQMSLSHCYLLRIRINQVREVSIVYYQWIVIIAYGIPFH